MHPPFIAAQRLWRLVCPPNFQWDCLAAVPLGVLPDAGDSTGVQPIPVHGLPSGECRWELINPASPAGPNRPAYPARRRREFLGDMSVTRLCVTIDAGVGKTTALKQMQCLRQTGVNGNCLAMLLQFAGLPTEADGIPKLLMEQLRNTPRTRTLAAGELWNLIERLIRRQGFTL
ncbi:MAG: hypothetical protein NTY19_08060, partial [Planctomycetota bacterium]|nr:hypothetical protein [Planctomycetota bacterium]